jgi:protein-tyrosine phosphatase
MSAPDAVAVPIGRKMEADGRRLGLVGALNFRDLGGYPVQGGGVTRWGRVFRSDSLHDLTPEDLERLDDLGVGVICDLRRAGEIDDAPGPRPHIHVELPSRTLGDTDPATLRLRADGERWLFEDYRGMLDHGAIVFVRTFSEVARTGERPAVFHCWGGKDRTGMTAALLLCALGVERNTILDDYQLTSRYRGVDQTPEVVDLFVSTGMTRAAAEGLLSTPRWTMAAALDHLQAACGGIDRYLCRQGGMTPAALAHLRATLTH